ncbi:hypothetical protein [Candidatus Nanohalococcus occultus]|uniref:Uncharacterized protein n=1 Tax=Candidatus Nanohalococcus occultus TaxID=2978047 RepID=A0ABY8CDP2_9ARCH|nr:hypothetical protein SVXNc_0312 [Candidatus Nanohaloarchaeota archaeon SVXNc]
MDLLGKQAEEAKQGVQQVSDQIDQLESHLNAVDSALQDYMENSGAVLNADLKVEESQTSEIDREKTEIQRLESKIDEMSEQMSRIQKHQRKNTEMIKQITDSQLLDTIQKIRKLVNTSNKRFYNLQSDFTDLEDRLNELENDFVMEVNSREFDFEKKLDARKFKEERKEVREELSKLRASVNFLADDEEEDELRID